MIHSKLIVLGASAGGLKAITTIVKELPDNFIVPLVVVQHLPSRRNDFWVNNLNSICKLNVKEAEEKENIQEGNIYLAPPNYHLLIEEDKTFSLSIDEKVNFSRPSIDVLFETAAEVFRHDLTGVLLTGSSKDGAAGLKKIKAMGGKVIVQDPQTAEHDFMPKAAIELVEPDHVLSLEEIVKLITG